MAPELPGDIWQAILVRHGPIALAPCLRGVDPAAVAASRLQHAWRATVRAIPEKWVHGALVLVRTARDTWERGQMFRSSFWSSGDSAQVLWGIDFFEHRPRRRYRFYYAQSDVRPRMRVAPSGMRRSRLLCSPR